MKSTTYKLFNLLILTIMVNSVQAQNDNVIVQYGDGSENRQSQYNPNQPIQNNGYGQTQTNNQQYQSNNQMPNGNSGLGENLYQGNTPNYNLNQNPRQNQNTGENPRNYTNNPDPRYNSGYNTGQNPNTGRNTGGYSNNPNMNPTGTQPNLNNGELKDFGVQPTKQLYAGSPHGPTPTSIPGGRVITTNQLQSMVMNGQNNTLIFDVLDGPQHLPGAIPASQGAAPGTFSDQTQQKMGQFLSQVTRGNKQTAMVYYCQSNYCWMSYNAALRAINLGYTNVYWYRGGIEAWQTKGLSVQYANNNRNY